jgi:hypothetical protein
MGDGRELPGETGFPRISFAFSLGARRFVWLPKHSCNPQTRSLRSGCGICSVLSKRQSRPFLFASIGASLKCLRISHARYAVSVI